MRSFASADPGRLQQVFWNILKNATKFTPPRGWIQVSSMDTEDGRLLIAFTDSGAGISPEALGKIFQPFEQGSAEVVRRYGGLGLGLSLSKAFIEERRGERSTRRARASGSDRRSRSACPLSIRRRAVWRATRIPVRAPAPIAGWKFFWSRITMTRRAYSAGFWSGWGIACAALIPSRRRSPRLTVHLICCSAISDCPMGRASN